MVGAVGVRMALVCGVVQVVPVGEMASVGWGVTMPIVIMVGVSIGQSMSQAAVVAGRRAQGVHSKATVSVTV